METNTLYAEDGLDMYLELGTEIAPVLVRWSMASPGGSRHDGYALMSNEGPVLIDPPFRTDAAAARVLAVLGARPCATVLTDDWHERSCYAVRELWGTPVWGPAAGLPERGGELDGRPDHAYELGTPLPGGLRALSVEGVFAGEHVLWWRAPTGEGVLFTGDTLSGQVTEQHPQQENARWVPGLYLGAGMRYVASLPAPSRLQASLRRVLSEDIDLICASHARPYRSHAKTALTHLLMQDWPALIQAGGRPAVFDEMLEWTEFGERPSGSRLLRHRQV